MAGPENGGKGWQVEAHAKGKTQQVPVLWPKWHPKRTYPPRHPEAQGRPACLAGELIAVPNRWKQIHAELQGYPPGMRSAVVFLAGKGNHPEATTSAAGRGPKFAGCKVLWKPKGAH